MDKSALEQLLVDSLEDLRLDKQERRALRQQLQAMKEAERNYVRNRAFELARDTIEAEDDSAALVLHWLQKVVKACKLDGAFSMEDKAYFSPGTTCRSAIIGQLQKAKQSIDICVFTISDDNISAAILAAHRRGVAVRIISDNDKSEDRGSDIERLEAEGIPLRLDDSPNHMHHKFALFDRRVLLNGSFNWTRSATDRNQENIVVTADHGLLRSFGILFEQLWQAYR
ncbi:MAG: phospholipase D-like domain-containing protein [Cellvibrionaceae bacterium]|nr:phospholipase D-like domain-containing protein [Cellvibrionaceae bacterium]MCV6627581.1 phospholipase D-like domain-containing protein [Cellvibrionaceae bacterium]